MSKDYYKVLGIEKGANDEAIKKAFRKKAHEYHPDKSTGDEAKFKEVNEAYQVLKDKNKKTQYDQFGSDFANGAGTGFSGGGGFNQGGFNVNMDDLGDMFGDIGDMFGFGGGRGKSSYRSKGADIQVEVQIDFLEAVFGIQKEINIRKKIKCSHCNGNGAEPGTKIDICKTCKGTGKVTRVQRTILGNMQVQAICEDCVGEGKIYNQKCSKCSGTGVVIENVKLKVKIPAGIDNGEVIRINDQGEAGEKGASIGDLYLRIRVKNDQRFERDGYNIRSRSEINFAQATLGDKIDIETVDGVVKLKIPAGTQSGTIFKIKAKGITKLRGYGKGDHLVKVIVVIPLNLNREQKSLLKKMNLDR